MTSNIFKLAAVFWTIIVVASAGTLSAQTSQPAIVPLDVKTALAIARTNFPRIRAKIAERQSATYDLDATKNIYLPNLILQGQVINATSNQLRGTFFPNEGTAIPVSGGIKVNGYTYDAVWTSFATALINWKFFNFGKNKATIDAAKAGLAVAEADYQNEVFQHQVQVCDAFLLARTLDNMVRAQVSNQQRVKALRDVIRAYSLSGLRPGVDSSLVNAEFSKATLLLLEARRMAIEQHVFLKEMLGMSGTDELALDSAGMSSLPQGIDLNRSFANNPRLTLFRNDAELQRLRVASIRKKELPSVSFLAAGWGRGSGITDRLKDNGDFVYNTSFSSGVAMRAYNYMVGISTIWNVTSLFKTGNEAKAQRELAKAAEEKLNEENLKVEGDWERAKLRYQAAVEVARQTPVQLTAARDAYQQAKARYDAGLSTVLELTQTFAVLNRAEVDAAVATANVWRAILQYAAATGDFEIFITNLQ